MSPRGNSQCQNDYSGAESVLPSILKNLDVYTRDGEIADYYWVPIMTECFLSRVLGSGKNLDQAVDELNAVVEKTLNEIQSR